MDLLTVARQCHNDNPWNDDSLTPFYLSAPSDDVDAVQIGFLRTCVVEQIRQDHKEQKAQELRFEQDARRKTIVHIDTACRTNEDRSNALKRIVEDWRARDLFPDPLKGWRNELYSVYGASRKEAFKLERASCALFGVTTFGVHATAYTSDYAVWVPRRAKTKATFPAMLDNSAAGGVSAGEAHFTSMVRECGEEAGLDAELVRKRMRQTGVVSYFYRSQAGWVQPEVEYTYDILLDDDVTPHPVDGEAEEFRLMDKDEVMRRIRQGEFKPNCALVLIDFFVRHGLITIEDCDGDYLALVNILHNDLHLPGP